MISNISVLNTVKDNAADFFVDADGFLNITGCPKIKAKTAKVNTTAIVASTPAVNTVTFTAVNSYTYNFRVTGYDATNTLVTLTMAYTSPSSGATATTIATAIAARINASPIAAQFASVVGGATLVLTGTSANPLISFQNFSADPNIAVVITTAGIEAQGLGSDLLLAYGGFVGGSSIVAANSYTQHEITLNPDIINAGQAAYETGLTTYIVLVNASAVTGGIDNVAINIDLINNANYGTVALLKANYRAIVADGLSSTAAITTGAAITLAAAATATVTGSITGTTMTVTAVTTALIVKGMTITGTGVTASTAVLGQLTGTIGGIGTYLVDRASSATSTTLTGTSGTAATTANLGVQSGDYFVSTTASATLPFNAFTSTKVTGVTSLTAGFGTGVTAAAATTAVFKYIAVRNIAN
jgi:hypothetical protein